MNNNILDFDEINEMLMKDEKRQNNYRTGELDEDSKILERFTAKYKPALQNFYDSSDDPKGERFKVETAQLISSNTGINFDRAYSYLDMLGGDIYNRDIDTQGVMEGFINSVKEAHYTRLNGKAMTKWEITGNDKYLKQADEYNEEALKHHVHDDYNLLGDLFIASAQPAYSVSRFLINDLAIKGSAFAISTILGGGVPFAAIAGTKAVDLASKAYNLYDSGTVQAGNTYYNLSKIEDADGNKIDLQSPLAKTSFALMALVQGFIEVGSMEFMPGYKKLQQALGPKVMGNVLTKSIKDKVFDFGADWVKGLASESLEEGMQSIVEDLTSNLLKTHENKIKNAGFELDQAKDIFSKSFSSMLDAAKSMVLFGAISGGIGNGAIATRAKIDANKSFKNESNDNNKKGSKTVDKRYVVNDSHDNDESFEKEVQTKLKNIKKEKLDIPTGVPVGMSIRPKSREDSVLIEAGLRNGSKFLKMNVGEFDAATADVQQDMLNAYAYRFGGKIDNKTNTINIPNKEVYNYSINQLAKDSYDLQKNEDNSYSFKLRDHSGKAFTINIKSNEKPSKEYIEPDSTKASELSLPSFMKSIMKAKTDLTISPEVQTSLKKKYSNILSKKEISNVAGLYNVLSKGTGKSVSELDNIIEFRFETNEEINNVAMQSMLSQGLSQEEATAKLNSKIYRGYHSVQEGKQVITLTPNKNATTIFHEMGHVFSNLLSPEQKAVFSKAYNGQIGAMWASDIKSENNQFKLGDNTYKSYNEAFKQIVPNEERFADDFVAYVSTGVASSEELKGIFEKFKEFLTEFINTFSSRLSDSTIKAFDEILNGNPDNISEKLNNNIDSLNIMLQSDEIEKVKQKYNSYKIDKNGKKTYLAPNGKVSNLPESLYFIVRTSSFKNWFGDWEKDIENSSKVVDENGEPLVVYHGSGETFEKFDKKTIGRNYYESERTGFFFTKKKSTAKNYSILAEKDNGNKKVYQVFLNIKNPVLSSVNSDYLSPIDSFDMRSNSLMEGINFENKDGIVITGTNNDDMYLVIEPNQIKSIFNNGNFNSDNDSILFQSENKRTKVINENGTLIALHNISESNLIKAYNLGGMPMPSIAITKPEVNHNGFGEITFVGDNKLGNFLIENGYVYNRDIWSVRFPEPEYKVIKKNFSEFDTKLKELKKLVDNDDYFCSLTSLYSSQYETPKKLMRFYQDESYMLDIYKYQENISKNKKIDKNSEEFENWLYDLIKPLYSDGFLTIKGKKVDYNLFNIFNYMKTNDKISQIPLGMTYPKQKALAFTAQRLINRAQLKKYEDLIENIKDPEELLELKSDISKADSLAIENYKFRDTWEALNDYSKVFADYYKSSKKESEEKIIKALEKNDFEVSDDFVKTTLELAEKMRKRKRAYFEAKPKTIMQPSDFVAAIVPETTSTKLVETLREDGLQVEFYNNNRQEVLNNFINNNENSILFQSENIIDIFDKNFKENKKALDLFETNLMNLNINQRFKPNTYFKILEHTPLIFNELGYDDKPFVIYKSKIPQILSTEKISNGTPHGKEIDKKIMIDAFKAISNPVAVFNSVRKNKINNKYEKVKDHFVILVDILDKFNNGIIIPIHLEKNISNIKVNIISSVYGKDNTQKYVLNNLKNNNLVYLDKNKSDYVAFMPNFYGGNSSRLSDSVNTVLTKEDIVNQYHFDEGQNLYQSDDIIDSIEKYQVYSKYNNKTSSVPQDKLQLLSRSTVTSSKLSVIRRDDIVNKYNLERNQKLWQSEPEEKDSIFNNFDISDIEEALNRNFYVPSSSLYPLIDKSDVVRREIELRKDLAAFPWILDTARACDTLDEFLQHINELKYDESLGDRAAYDIENFHEDWFKDKKSQRNIAVKIYELSRVITPKQADRVFINSISDKYDLINLAIELNTPYMDVVDKKTIVKQPVFKGVSSTVLAINENSSRDKINQALNQIRMNPQAYRQALIVKQQAEQRVKVHNGDNDVSDISDRLAYSEMFLKEDVVDEELSTFSDFKSVKIDDEIREKNLTNIEVTEEYLEKQLNELEAKDKEIKEIKKEIKSLEKTIDKLNQEKEKNKDYKKEFNNLNNQLKKANRTIELLKEAEINRKARITRDELIKNIKINSRFNIQIHDAKYKEGLDWIHKLFDKENREVSSLNIPFADEFNRPGNEVLYIPENLIKYLPKDFVLTRDNRVSRWTVDDLKILELVTQQFREDAKVSLFLRNEEIKTKRSKFNNDYFTQMYGRQAERFDDNLGYASSINKDVRQNVNLAPENKFYHGQETGIRKKINTISTSIVHIQRAARYLDGQQEGLLYDFFVKELHNNYSLYYKNKHIRLENLDKYMNEKGLSINYLAEKIYSYKTPSTTIDLTREQCIGVFIYSLNKYGIPKLMSVGGNGLSYQDIANIDNLLSKQDKEFAFKMIDLIGKGDSVERLDEVSYRVYNKILKKEKNYFPLSAQSIEPEDKKTSKTKIIGEKKTLQGFVDNGMMNERVDAVYPLDLDVVSTFKSQVDAQERTIYFSQWVKDAEYYLGRNTSVGQIIASLYGDTWRTNLQSFVNKVALVSAEIVQLEKWANKMLSTVSASKITYSLSAAMHQFASLGAGVRGDIDIDILIATFLKPNTKQMKKDMELLDPNMKNRVFNLEVSRYRDLAHTSKAAREISKVVDKGMFLSEITDSYVTTNFWWGVYKTQIRKGKTEKEAIFRASQFISETQSSSNEMDLSEIQSGKTNLLRSLARFKNDNFQKWNQLFFDLPYYIKTGQYKNVFGTIFSNLLSAGLFVATTGLLYQAVGDDEDKFKKMFRIFLDAVYHQLIGDVIPLVGDDVSNAMEGYSFGTTKIAAATLNSIFSLLDEVTDMDGDSEALADKSVNFVSEILGLMFGLPSVQGKRVYKAIKEKDALRLLGGYWASKE